MATSANVLTTHSFCLDTVAFNKVSSYSNALCNNISKTVLLFKIGPEMTKLDLNYDYFNQKNSCLATDHADLMPGVRFYGT